MRPFVRNKLTLVGAVLVMLLALAALLAPLLSPHDPAAIDLSRRLIGPCREHPMGTEQLGRDVFSRMLYGSRISLLVGFVAVGIAMVVGSLLGATAGYFGGWLEWSLMRFVDVMLSFPTIFLILAVVAFIEPGLGPIAIIIGLTGWMGVARLVRAEVLSLKEREFILAARAMGASNARIIFRHLLPNAMAPVVVSATLGIGSAILIESGLSFLGLGVQPPMPSWGNILTEGKDTMGVAWWLTLVPGTAIFSVVLGCNLLGEGLRRWQTGSTK